MRTVRTLYPCIATRSSLRDSLVEGIHISPSPRCYNAHSYISHTSTVERPFAMPSTNLLSKDNAASAKALLRKTRRWSNSQSISLDHIGSNWQSKDHILQLSTSRRFSVCSHSSFSNDHSRMRTPFNNATSYPHAHFTSSTSSPPLDDSAGGIFPYTSANNFDFSRCTNPAQLEKSIVSYLKSHPMPGERALLAMLTACADISRTVAPSHEQDHQPHKTWDQIKPKRNNSSDRFSTNLLQTILQSFEFTPEDVFKIARSVYYDIPKGSFAGGAYSNTISLTKPSLDVTNTFLHVCETTGHFDEAWLVVNEMMNRKQGDVKPDLATYRYVLRAAALQRRRHTGESLDIAEIDTKVDGIIEYASNSLSKQSRIALLVKLGLGGLVGATAFKFTMMGVMALPSLSTFSKSIEDLGKEQSTVVGAHQPDGIIHFLASQEVALGVGLAAGLLTASYFIRGSTQKIAVNAKQEPALKSRNQQIQDDLPRASIFGLYFPDLKTTSKSEIQNYLRKNAGL